MTMKTAKQIGVHCKANSWKHPIIFVKTYYVMWWAASYVSWSLILLFTTGALRNKNRSELGFHFGTRNDSQNVPIRSTLHWNTVRHFATYKYLKVIQPASHSSVHKLSCRWSFKQIQPLTPATTLASVCRRRRRQTRRTGGVNRTVVRSPPLHPDVTEYMTLNEE
jgi:hypothetical protein